MYTMIVRHLNAFPHYMRNMLSSLQTKLQTTLYLFVKRITSIALLRNWALIVTSQVMLHTNVCSFDKNEILNNHKSFMSSLNIETKCKDIPYLYWIPKLYKNPSAQRTICKKNKQKKPITTLYFNIKKNLVRDLLRRISSYF